MTTPRLKHISDVTGPARVPRYIPSDHEAGIVHLGIGAFHRAHQAVMTDDAIASQGGDWRIIAVSLRSRDLADRLNAQNGLYTLIERNRAGTSARVVGAIERVIAADAAATLGTLCDPGIRIVTLTVTEKGYGIDRESRLPDSNHPSVAADLGQPEAPCGVLGLLVAAMKRRRTEGSPPLTLLSCDNLPENGALLRDGVLGFARLTGSDELADWIESNIAFPSSMVDRITPASTVDTLSEALKQTGCNDQAAVETEPFIQWVIEDNFASGRPQWEAGGTLFVKDVTPYERMKLTMLNGSHSMLAYAGFLSGCNYVRDVMNDLDLSALIWRHHKAAADLLQPLPGINFNDYATALAERFANPLIAHETFQIAMDGSEKLPQRIFQPAIEALNAKKDIRPFAFTTAMWMRFCLRRHDDGKCYDLHDPRTEELATAIDTTNHSASGISDAIHTLPQLIPQRLVSDPLWRAAIEEILSTALNDGCRAAIQREAADFT